jgi:glycosyltransferase involved in cell wall biosynthesis
MAKPLFSIVIPTYNRQDLVTYAIESVIRQTLDDYEIIVCDNFSTDNTATVVGQFKDSRVKYLRTPQHFVIADNWEYARTQAKGQLVLMLADDDALVSSALEHFYREFKQRSAEFMFVTIAEYRDNGFPGPEQNILDCPPFSGSSRILQAEEMLTPLFSFAGEQYNMHPSGFVFAKAIGDLVASRTGRFFQTNGVEFFAWPAAAVLSNKIVHIDAPLVICGRTKKSWGSNLRFCNPGKENIKKFTDDVEQKRKSAPLTNFTMSNLIAEGLLTAKKLFPNEFEKYIFDEAQYLMATMWELKERKDLGVDVSDEMEEINQYLVNNPGLKTEISRKERLAGGGPQKTIWKTLRSSVGDLGFRRIRTRIRKPRQVREETMQDAQKIKQGEVKTGLRISGKDFGFHDILGCAEFLASITTEKK